MFKCPYCQKNLVLAKGSTEEDREDIKNGKLKYFCPTGLCKGLYFDSYGKVYRILHKTRFETLIILACEDNA